MTTLSRRVVALAIGLSLPALNGCAGTEADQSEELPPAQGEVRVPGGPAGQGLMRRGPGRGAPPPSFGGPPGPIQGVMRKLAQGPNALNRTLNEALKADSPDWAAIQPQAKELVSLAKELGPEDPPRGSKESWKELTDAFLRVAEELDKAAEAKDKAGVTAARDALKNSCAACHNAHQNKRGGFGPPGGGQPGGPRPGGEQPGGPALGEPGAGAPGDASADEKPKS